MVMVTVLQDDGSRVVFDERERPVPNRFVFASRNTGLFAGRAFSGGAAFRDLGFNRDEGCWSVELCFPSEVYGDGMDDPRGVEWVKRETVSLERFWVERYSTSVMASHWNSDYAYAVRLALHRAYESADPGDNTPPMRRFTLMSELIMLHGPSVMNIPYRMMTELYKHLSATVKVIAEYLGCVDYYKRGDTTVTYDSVDDVIRSDNRGFFGLCTDEYESYPVFDAGYVDLLESCDDAALDELYDLCNYGSQLSPYMAPMSKNRVASRLVMQHALRAYGKRGVLVLNELNRYAYMLQRNGVDTSVVNRVVPVADDDWVAEAVSVPFPVYRENLYAGDYNANAASNGNNECSVDSERIVPTVNMRAVLADAYNEWYSVTS